MIQHLRESLRPTAITITHDLKVAFSIADRVALLESGRIRIERSPAEFESSDDTSVRSFVRGDSSLDEEAVPLEVSR